MSIRENNFTCKREGLQIRGKEFFPVDFDENKQYPAIIFSHGFTGNYLGVEQYCREFARLGYITFCFNFCGGGTPEDEEGFKSDGKTTDMTVLTEVKDLSAVLEYVHSFAYVDQRDTILAGFSQGGFVSGLTAAKYPGKISKLIMVFPALCIPDHARRGCLGGAVYDPGDVPKYIDCGRTVLGKKIHEEMVVFDPYLELSAYKGPVLILHGYEDDIVNYSYSIRAKENYEEGQCHLQLIRNMGHSTDGSHYESAVGSMRQFLNDREEILSIRIIITHEEKEKIENVDKVNIFFTGYCETEYFQGTVLPGGCDAQEYCNGEALKIRAEYILEGLDATGERCKIHIVNQKKGTEWIPTVETDSKALQWMNGAELTAVLEYAEGGPTVRIFREKSFGHPV